VRCVAERAFVRPVHQELVAQGFVVHHEHWLESDFGASRSRFFFVLSRELQVTHAQ
jgi:hypothetical protein